MQITAVKTTLHVPPGARRAAGARTCIVRIETDAGISGIAVASERMRAEIMRIGRRSLTGEDPRALTGLWPLLLNESRHNRRLAEGIAALDIALWDLKARINKEPLWKTLGGARPRARVHGPVTLIERGLSGGVLRLGKDHAADRRRLDMMHGALKANGTEPDCIVEVGGKWPAAQVIRRLRALEKEFDISCVRGAPPGRDFEGLRRVSASVRTAVCAGRDLCGLRDFVPLFRHRAADVIELDINRLGISAALQIADAAFGYELPVLLSPSPGNIGAHVSAVIPMLMSMEISDALPPGIERTDVRIENGRAVAGDLPGHGLEAA